MIELPESKLEKFSDSYAKTKYLYSFISKDILLEFETIPFSKNHKTQLLCKAKLYDMWLYNLPMFNKLILELRNTEFLNAIRHIYMQKAYLIAKEFNTTFGNEYLKFKNNMERHLKKRNKMLLNIEPTNVTTKNSINNHNANTNNNEVNDNVYVNENANLTEAKQDNFQTDISAIMSKLIADNNVSIYDLNDEVVPASVSLTSPLNLPTSLNLPTTPTTTTTTTAVIPVETIVKKRKPKRIDNEKKKKKCRKELVSNNDIKK